MGTLSMKIERHHSQPRLSAIVGYGDLIFLSGQTPASSDDDIRQQTRGGFSKN